MATAGGELSAPIRAPGTHFARITGGLLLVMAVCAMFAEMGVRSALVVPGDASATAANLVASPGLFRLGFAGYLAAFLCDVPVAVLFYALLRPVNQTVALVAMAFRLVYTAIVGACLLHYFGAMVFLGGGDYLTAFQPNQLQALALYCLNMYDHGFSMALVFFGIHLALLGMLLYQSKQLPGVFAVLVALGGFAYLINGFSFFLAPVFHAQVSPLLGMLAMSELLLALWLAVKGLKPRIPLIQD